jgi:hypothetical protein
MSVINKFLLKYNKKITAREIFFQLFQWKPKYAGKKVQTATGLTVKLTPSLLFYISLKSSHIHHHFI